MAKLILFLPDSTTVDIPLNRERVTIGRRADNDICLPNLAVSGEHAAVVTILADSFLEDLGSTNGTLVNGNAIAKHFLRDRDEIDVGWHKIIYCADDDTVIVPDVTRTSLRAAKGDLAQQVEPAKPIAKPIVRGKRSSGPGQRAMRGDTASSRGVAATPSPKIPVPLIERGAAAPEPASGARALIKVLSGPDAGRTIAITKENTTVGRAGVQVALISQSGQSFELRPLEGDTAPQVNGQPAHSNGVALASGDVLEVAGSKLEFLMLGTK